MDDPEILRTTEIWNTTFFHSFRDHTGAAALSATYPVEAAIQNRVAYFNVLQNGDVEDFYAYPCFQLYRSISYDFLEDVNGFGCNETKLNICDAIADLLTNKFFEVFKGVRFEVYNGRPTFNRDQHPGLSDFRSMVKHAINERNDRNMLSIYRVAVTEINTLQTIYDGMKAAGANTNALQQQDDYVSQAQIAIYEAGALLCPEMARLNDWKRDLEAREQVQVERRRTSMHELDFQQEQVRSRSNSTGGITCPKNGTQEVPAHQAWRRGRLRELSEQLVRRFYAPIIPNSFYYPPGQPYHGLILVMKDHDIKESLYMVQSKPEFSSEGNLVKQMEVPRKADYTMERLAVGTKQPGDKTVSLGIGLARFLYAAGLGAPPPTTKLAEMVWFPAQESRKEDHGATIPDRDTVEAELRALDFDFE